MVSDYTKDRIVREFNGSNEDELARRYDVTREFVRDTVIKRYFAQLEQTHFPDEPGDGPSITIEGDAYRALAQLCAQRQALTEDLRKQDVFTEETLRDVQAAVDMLGNQIANELCELLDAAPLFQTTSNNNG